MMRRVEAIFSPSFSVNSLVGRTGQGEVGHSEMLEGIGGRSWRARHRTMRRGQAGMRAQNAAARRRGEGEPQLVVHHDTT